LKAFNLKAFSLKSFDKFSAFSALTALLVAATLAVTISCFHRIEQATAARQHSSWVLTQANTLLSALKDVETGQRGYLLTHDERFLEPYLLARNDIAAHMSNLYTITTGDAERERLDKIAPLIETLMAEIARLIELRRADNINEISAQLLQGHGKRLMDSIRNEIVEFNKIEQHFYAEQDVAVQSNLRKMFRIIVIGSIAWALFALAFIYLIYRQSQQRLNNLVLLETQDLLAEHNKNNQQLQQLNLTLHDSEEKLTVTLNSIGDAVITTDADARVTMLNPLAEKLSGWTQTEAFGRPIAEIFKIINKETRLAVISPVMATLADVKVHGLTNHTVLVSRQGSECDIADSCAPIRGRDRQVVGAVLVFRNVTEEYAVQQALRDNASLIQTILNTVADGIITLRASDGMIETVNPTGQSMFGFSAAELRGRNFSELIPELDQEQRNGSLKHYSASEEARANGVGREVVGWRKDDTPFPVEIVVSEMWLGGERYFTCILRDISARKLAEASLLKAGALQNAIFNSANFSSIATDAHGVIQIFNVGAHAWLQCSRGNEYHHPCRNF
jgi:PAS domain S-box-containing protein